MALITSPILGLYSIIPISLFIFSLPEEQFPEIFENPWRISKAFAVATTATLIIWMFNIWLYGLFKSEAIRWRKAWTRYVASYFITIFVVSCFALFFLLVRADPPVKKFSLIRFYPFLGAIANNTFILILVDLIVTRGKKAELEIEKRQLELANLVAQHEQLKHQIHPHFLFNALSTLKILIKKQPDVAELYVIRLSSFLRSTLSESTQETIKIKKDLSFFEDYMELQKMRFKSAIDYNYYLPDSILEYGTLPIFTLQFLAENAIKHNAFTTEEPLKIDIRYTGDGTIAFSNNLLPKFQKESSTAIGLANLSERYKLLSGPVPKVKIDQEKKQFTVEVNVLEA